LQINYFREPYSRAATRNQDVTPECDRED